MPPPLRSVRSVIAGPLVPPPVAGTAVGSVVGVFVAVGVLEGLPLADTTGSVNCANALPNVTSKVCEATLLFSTNVTAPLNRFASTCAADLSAGLYSIVVAVWVVEAVEALPAV